MKFFKTNELMQQRRTIVELKKKGYSLPAIAKMLKPFCVNPSENFARSVRYQWEAVSADMDVYLAHVDEMEDNSDELIAVSVTQHGETVGKLITEKEAVAAEMTTQEVEQCEDGTKMSTKEFPNHAGTNVDNMSADKILLLHGFSPDEYTLVSCKVSKWNSVLDGETIEMVSQKISVKPIAEEDNLYSDDFSKSVIYGNQLFEEAYKSQEKVPLMESNGDIVAILPLADYHLDKREPGKAHSFDKQVQEFVMILEHFKKFVQDDLDRIQRIIFFWSQDFFNYDYLNETTTSGKNKQDAEGGYHRMVLTGTWLLVNAVKELSKLKPVELFYTRSNHDEHTAFNAMNTLYYAFANNENVFIDGKNAQERAQVEDRIRTQISNGEPVGDLAVFDASPRAYYRFGDCLFGFGHGDKEGTRIGTLMQTEASRQFIRRYAQMHNLPYEYVRKEVVFEDKTPWDSTDVHIFFLGHFHSKQVSKDNGGVELIYLGTVMSGDKWHEDCGYVGARRDIEFYKYDVHGNATTMRVRAKNLNLQGDIGVMPNYKEIVK